MLQFRTSSPPRQGAVNGIALVVYRPSLHRWATVGKLAFVDGEPVLAVPYRRRQRLQGRVSLPLVAIRYAEEHGATAIVVRFDDEHAAYRLPLKEALRLGRREMLDGQLEVWLSLDWFEACPWPDWPFATREVRLGPGPDELPRQLALAGGR